MVEIRQAEDDLPGKGFLDDPCGHTSGLLCRRHAQHSVRLPLWAETNDLDERIGDLSSFETGHTASLRLAHQQE
jgi:hypothetical protein